MRKFIPAVFIFLLMSCKDQTSTIVSDISLEKKKIIDLEYKCLKAEFALDTATISQVMDEDFIEINDLAPLDKHQTLKAIYRNIKSRLESNHVVDSLYLDKIDVRFHGNAAIATFITVTKGRIKDETFENRRMRWYDVWIKKDTAWKIVSSQGTFLEPSID